MFVPVVLNDDIGGLELGLGLVLHDFEDGIEVTAHCGISFLQCLNIQLSC